MMIGFLCFMGGLSIGIFVMALFTEEYLAALQAKRNSEDKERAEHAIKMAEYYKDKYEKMKNKIGWDEND